MSVETSTQKDFSDINTRETKLLKEWLFSCHYWYWKVIQWL